MVDAASIQKDDVVAYKEQGQVFFGRVMTKITGTDGTAQFFVKADGVSVEKMEPITHLDVIGIYHQVLHGWGSVALFLQTPLGIVAFLIIPVALFLGYESVSRVWKRKKVTQQQQTLPNEQKKRTEPLQQKDPIKK